MRKARPLGHLPTPRPPFRVDRHAAGFETKAEAHLEDVKERTPSLKRLALSNPSLAAVATDLASRIAAEAETLASKLSIRGLRIKVVGAIWQLVEKTGVANVRFFTLIGRGWRYGPDDLANANPVKLAKRLRMDLQRAGSGEASGWLIAFVHGQWDSATGEYQLHYHGIATGGMVQVVNRLRHRRKYKRHPYSDADPVWTRVVLEKFGLTKLPAPLTYLVQAFWDMKPTRKRLHGRDHGEGRKRRIPDPYQALYLLWLDRWTLDDLCVRLKLRVTDSGIETIQ